MESIWNKFSYDRAAVIEDAFSIATNHGQQEWSNAAVSQAVDDIVFSLGGDEGLTFAEFEILVAYAARVDPRTQLAFLDNLVDIIRASRGIESFSEYDQRFLDFVVGIHDGLTVARGANLGLGETTRTWKSEFEEVSGAGKYTRSVVETVTGDAFMSGGAYSTMSTTSSSFTPSSAFMLDTREGSMDINPSVEDFAEMTPERGLGDGRFCSTLEGMSDLKLEPEALVNLQASDWDGFYSGASL
ncbi:hypothetical protein FOC1_g10000556 [Fusarium oxysporum f. sp. cubense race 1]|uniref:Uncharacterized protein n=1 Tax=Fusarium oxysporum f. sp. cubense (strain race 1) TaxID=1229664 RepID=N4TKN4_FUSC1|nr:hypothetical protein FOC1_g10000556 [Fusarium oxysporum f. sp. cubense race 1]